MGEEDGEDEKEDEDQDGDGRRRSWGSGLRRRRRLCRSALGICYCRLPFIPSGTRMIFFTIGDVSRRASGRGAAVRNTAGGKDSGLIWAEAKEKISRREAEG